MKKHLSLALIIALSLLLRLPLISGSFWLDEAAQALESSRPIQEQYRISGDFQPPLLHYIVHYLLYFTHAEAGLRSVSLISGIISIVFIYLILKEKVGEQAATTAGILLAINPFHIFFSQELRPYALATMFACISWWALLVNKDKRSSLLFVATTVGGLFSMYLYPLVMLSQVLFVLIEQKNKLKSTVVGVLTASIIFLPWLPFFMEQLGVGVNLATVWPGWSQVVSTPALKALPMVLAKFMVGSVELKDSMLYYLMAGLAIVVVLGATWSIWREKKNRFLVYWFLVPVIGAWLISFVVPVLLPKRVMMVLPAMIGILAVWSGGRHWSGRRLAVYFVGIVFLCSTLLYWSTPRYQRENWRELIKIIESDALGKKSIAVFAFPEPFAPWRWYGAKGVASAATGSLRVSSEPQLDEPFVRVPEYERVYVFDHLIDLSDPDEYMKIWLIHRGYQGVRTLDGGNVGFVRVFDSL